MTHAANPNDDEGSASAEPSLVQVAQAMFDAWFKDSQATISEFAPQLGEALKREKGDDNDRDDGA